MHFSQLRLQRRALRRRGEKEEVVVHMSAFALLRVRRNGVAVDVERDAGARGPGMCSRIIDASLLLDLAQGGLQQTARGIVVPAGRQALLQKDVIDEQHLGTGWIENGRA